MHRERQQTPKSKKSSNKSLNKSEPKSANKTKNTSLPKSNSKRKGTTHIDIQNIPKQLRKKATQKSTLVKKKIQDLKTPDLIIKVSYKGKRVSIPISNVDDKSLKETVNPHIVRFERQILKNPSFNEKCIENWKTIGMGDILKDFYFQTKKPVSVFKGQVLQIQPIWRENRPEHVSLANFQIIKCIGTGGFSRVFLARYKQNGKFYALKLMQKEGLLQSGKQCVVTNERDIMVDLNNPHVLSLDFAFETKHFVVLALEYCPGGQLFYYLRKVRRLTEDEARYCFIEILLGIEYLHSQKIIYRDIKPENIMIDEDGNLKIADFGLSKMVIRPNELAYTYCGSPEYMAPQMLTKSGHSFSVDYYCLGALLYELVTGNPPFYSGDVEKIYYSIQNEEIDFPPHVELSNEIKMLLEGLLVKDPNRRLGSLGGIKQILGHPWVRKLKPADITNKTVPTPIKIDLLTFNINEEQIEEGDDDTFKMKLDDESNDFDEMFDGFYFNRFQDMKILDEAFPSVKSDSTKQNKSLNNKNQTTNHTAIGYTGNLPSNKKTIDIKSSMSREKMDKFSIELSKNKQPTSDMFRDEILKPKGIKLKKTKSKKRIIDLVERAKKRPEQKSRVKVINNTKSKMERAKSPNKTQLKKATNTLKRIKSSTALLNHTEIKHY